MSGRVSVAAEFARCRTCGLSPGPLGDAPAPSSERPRAGGRSVGWPGSSAYGEVATRRRPPRRRRRPAPSPRRRPAPASRRGWRAARPSPVSTLRCTRAVRPADAARPRPPRRAARRRRRPTGRRRPRPPRRAARPGPSSQASTGTSMPAARSASASRAVQTPSQVAPPASAARADGTMPWPYPSALTTAITCAVRPRCGSAATLSGSRRGRSRPAQAVSAYRRVTVEAGCRAHRPTGLLRAGRRAPRARVRRRGAAERGSAIAVGQCRRDIGSAVTGPAARGRAGRRGRARRRRHRPAPSAGSPAASSAP